MCAKLIAPATTARPPTNNAVAINNSLSVRVFIGSPPRRHGRARGASTGHRVLVRQDARNGRLRVINLYAHEGCARPRAARLGQPGTTVADWQPHGRGEV